MSPGGHLALMPFNPDARENYSKDTPPLVVHADDLVRRRADVQFLQRHARTIEDWQNQATTLRVELATEPQRTYSKERIAEQQGEGLPPREDLPARLPPTERVEPREPRQEGGPGKPTGVLDRMPMEPMDTKLPLNTEPPSAADKIIAAGPGGHLGLRPVTADGAPIVDAPCVVVHRDELAPGQKPALSMSDRILAKELGKSQPGTCSFIDLGSMEQLRHNAARQAQRDAKRQRDEQEKELGDQGR